MTDTPMTRLDMPYLDQQFINNQWVASHGQRRLAVTDSFREAVIALDIGAPISRHPGIDKVSFTGSNRVGEAIMRAASH
jgi:acyl-CoA reductase-like NAD-dependent aldehyde dehydrogenase